MATPNIPVRVADALYDYYGDTDFSRPQALTLASLPDSWKPAIAAASVESIPANTPVGSARRRYLEAAIGALEIGAPPRLRTPPGGGWKHRSPLQTRLSLGCHRKWTTKNSETLISLLLSEHTSDVLIATTLTGNTVCLACDISGDISPLPWSLYGVSGLRITVAAVRHNLGITDIETDGSPWMIAEPGKQLKTLVSRLGPGESVSVPWEQFKTMILENPHQKS